ncbi:MAG TPA: PAS domain S-box protein [Thermosulfurimonas dismutans]|uniref:PAS domain S-box protein n=1 Tax=Thermosulfurimonas dismutans TaxID=999894 RepID=A0A7C3GE97_9BACT|nr:PAS domain S-box protein [Thermosulfurimonas dismutans]
MFSFTLNYLRHSFNVGIVIFDQKFNIICTNETIEKILGFYFRHDDLINLSDLHSEKAFQKIRQMVNEAINDRRSDSYVLKIFPKKGEKDIILLGKVFLLDGQCQDKFIALLYDVTDLVMEGHQTIIKLPVYEGNDLLLLDAENIYFLKAAGNYTEIFCDNKVYLSPLSMAKIEKKLDPKQFMRIHRSFIVNITKVKKLTKTNGKYRILLQNSHTLPLSRNKIDIFLEMFGLK